MSDSSDLMLADGFVRAVLGDNERLRAENEALRKEIADGKIAAARELRVWQARVWRLVDAAGGNVRLDPPSYGEPRRLLIESKFGGEETLVLRLVPETDMTPLLYGEESLSRSDVDLAA